MLKIISHKVAQRYPGGHLEPHLQPPEDPYEVEDTETIEVYEDENCQGNLNSAEKEDIDGLIEDFNTAYIASSTKWGYAHDLLDIGSTCDDIPFPCAPHCLLFSGISTMTCGGVNGPSAEEALELNPPDYELACSRIVEADQILDTVWTFLNACSAHNDTMTAAFDAMEILMDDCNEE